MAYVLVPRVGLEPTRVLPHASLSRARLPIPPPRLDDAAQSNYNDEQAVDRIAVINSP